MPSTTISSTSKRRGGPIAFIGKRIYWYRLWTGTYMLSWWEQILFNVLFAIILYPFFYYSMKSSRPLFQFVKQQLMDKK